VTLRAGQQRSKCRQASCRRSSRRRVPSISPSSTALGVAAPITGAPGVVVKLSNRSFWQWRREADLVDKILRGTKSGDIPVEQPIKFDFIINLTAAKALG